MIIAVWGRSGTGKSLIANELGRHYARHAKLTVVVDTDMTQPTLPPKLPNAPKNNKASLGLIFASQQVRDAQPYFHQHHKGSKLFFAGLTKDDNYLSYEIGMRQHKQASSFVTACQDIADVVILDCSSQRGDPFLAVALDKADRFLLMHTPDTKNVCWYLGVKPLLAKKRNEHEVLHVVNAVQRHHATAEYEKTASIELTAVLPYSQSINEVDGQGNFASFSCDHQGRLWQKNFNADLIKNLESDPHE